MTNHERTPPTANKIPGSATQAVETNPFSTCCIRPGAVPFLFSPDGDARQLIARLRESAWWGQIVGEHGSGKSTLLQTLRPLLAEAGRQVELYVLHAGQTRVPFAQNAPRQWTADTQVVIDGYEQLGWHVRRRLQRQCRTSQAGLLVTAHRRLRLPVLWQTQPTVALAQAVVAQLLTPQHRQIVTAEDVSRAFAAQGGNLRETLFALYDVFAARRP